MKPARRVVTRSPHQNVGVVCCPWLQAEPVEFESITERWFLMNAVMLPRLQRIVHQPFRLDLPPLGATEQATTYVPDFLLEFVYGESIVIEVKPEAFLIKHRAKLLAAAEVLRARGHTFFVITDKHLRAAASMADAMQLRRMAKGTRPEDEVARALSVLQDVPGYTSAGDLCDVASIDLSFVGWLVGRGLVEIERPRGIDERTLVGHLSLTEDSHAALSVGRWFTAAPW